MVAVFYMALVSWYKYLHSLNGTLVHLSVICRNRDCLLTMYGGTAYFKIKFFGSFDLVVRLSL